MGTGGDEARVVGVMNMWYFSYYRYVFFLFLLWLGERRAKGQKLRKRRRG